MKREITFRGLAKDGRWYHGDFIADDNGARICYVVNVPPNMSDPGGNTLFIQQQIDIETLCQFTGLRSQKGQNIYEGDVCTKMISPDENNLVPRELSRGEIVYHVGGFCYYSGGYYYPLSRMHGVIECIGNIHQTPELLTH